MITTCRDNDGSDAELIVVMNTTNVNLINGVELASARVLME
jgi:hypothetical protein